MSTASNNLSELAKLYSSQDIEFPNLKAVTLAQWILESGWGRSALAQEHNNYAGMKWRSEMNGVAQPVRYVAHDGPDDYCRFDSPEAFIRGYWRFVDRAPYSGWRDHARDHASYIAFIGPIWAQDPVYVDKVLDLIPAAEDLLVQSAPPLSTGSSEMLQEEIAELPQGVLLAGRPSIMLSADGNIALGQNGLNIRYKGDDNAPYGNAATRNKQPFSGIVIHHTAPDHSAEWYVKYQIQGDPVRGGHFGYHFYISEVGGIYQGAPLGKRTNHISPDRRVRRDFFSVLQNNNSLGISCVGAGKPDGFAPTGAQLDSIRKLVFALSDVFSIPFTSVVGHGEIQSNRMRSEGTSISQEIRSW